MQVPILDAVGELLTALRSNLPIVLVAGQSLDSQSLSQDRILDLLLERIGLPAGGSWKDAIRRGLTDEDVSWLTERFERAVPSEAMAAIAEFPWSGVFTSSPDPKFARQFSTRGRQPEAVLASGTFARVSRSRSRPPIHYLFGKSNETHPGWVMPRTQAEFIRRKQVHALDLTNRISDTATSGGIVVIAGVDPQRDWLEIDAVLASLEASIGPRVIYFGASLADSAVAAELRKAGRLTEIAADLGNVLSDLYSISGDGVFSFASPDDPGTVTTSGGVLNITSAMRLRVEASASIVDDEWTVQHVQLSPSEQEEAFRRFHGDLGGFRVLVDGIGRGFAIVREFEGQLLATVNASVEKLSQATASIIVYGQSGTGKSVALARLVHEIRSKWKLPVLVATNRLPTYSDIEGFCEEAERVGAEATILVCDANLPAHRYRDFSSGLRSRGRRLLTVGTSYESEDYDPDAAYFVHAPAQLTGTEAKSLADLLERSGSSSIADKAVTATDTSFLAMLYRNLSVGREKITSGLSSEARHWEKVLRERAKATPRPKGLSSLARQLLELGIADGSQAVFESSADAAELGTDAAAKLVDYVMVPGRLNCPVPLNLVMRVLRFGESLLDIDQVAFLFSDLDIFRWRTSGDEGADLLLAPRLQIEADLICRRRVADTSREIDILVELIAATRAGGVDSDTERGFLLDLLQKLDREGPRRDAYRAGYLQFADALRDLRLKGGVQDASLMLRESVFRRQAVWSLDWAAQNEQELSDRLPILEAARATVEQAISLIDSGAIQASKRTKFNLVSERASIYGYLAVQRFKANDFEGSWSDYLAARIASAKAIAISDGYRPIDVALWTSSDMLKSEHLSPEQKSEIIAELYSTLDLVDTDTIQDSQKERFLERRHKVANLIGDSKLEQETLTALKEVSPATAAFLYSRIAAEPLLRSSAPLGAPEVAQARAVANGLLETLDREGIDDVRCQRLLLQCQWMASTGERLLKGERAGTPILEKDVRELLSTVQKLNDLLGTSARNQERYLEGVLAWIAKDFSESSELFRALSRDTEYEDRSRVIRRLILSGVDGDPAKFSGRIESAIRGGGWRIRLSGLDVSIPLLEHEFPGEKLAPGRELRNFGVAFNYVGPIADSLTRLQKRR